MPVKEQYTSIKLHVLYEESFVLQHHYRTISSSAMRISSIRCWDQQRFGVCTADIRWSTPPITWPGFSQSQRRTVNIGSDDEKNGYCRVWKPLTWSNIDPAFRARCNANHLPCSRHCQEVNAQQRSGCRFGACCDVHLHRVPNYGVSKSMGKILVIFQSGKVWKKYFFDLLVWKKK